MNNLMEIILTIRDVLLPFLPKFVVKSIMGKGDYVFLAHPIELLPDIARKYPFAQKLSKKWLKIISKNHPPIILSKVTGFKDQNEQPIEGWIVFCSLSTRMMLLNNKLARKKILAAAKYSEKLNIKLLGLGAFVPIVTDHGAYLQGKVKVSITNGDAFSAVIAVKNVIKAAEMANLDKNTIKLAIVGAAGFVGSICSKLLIRQFSNIVLIDKNIKGLEILYKTLTEKRLNTSLCVSSEIEEISNADLILVVTNTPGVIVRSKHLKSGAIVIDAAQPRNVSAKVPYEREDVLVIESGIAEVEGLHVNCDFGLKKENEVYSCFAELLLLCWMKMFDEDHIDPIPEDYVLKLWAESDKAGIKVADFRNITGFIDESKFAEIFKRPIVDKDAIHT